MLLTLRLNAGMLVKMVQRSMALEAWQGLRKQPEATSCRITAPNMRTLYLQQVHSGGHVTILLRNILILHSTKNSEAIHPVLKWITGVHLLLDQLGTLLALRTMAKTRFNSLPLSTSGPQDCALNGRALMNTPYLNKGSAFTQEERDEFDLDGLLPSRINDLEEQVARAYDQYNTHKTALGKNVFMSSMKEQNEVLYYRLIQDHVKEMFPIIYTPTVRRALLLPTLDS